MNANLKGKIIRAVSVCGDIFLVVFCIAFSLGLAGVYTDFINTAAMYSVAFLIFLVFNFIMFELYSVKAENVYNVLVATEISAIITYVIVYIISRFLRANQQPIAFWGLLAVTLLPFLGAWRSLIAIAKKKIGEKRSLLIIENMSNTSRLARKLKYASNEENQSWYHLLDENDEGELQTILDDVIEKFDAIFISPRISNRISSKILYRGLSMGKEVNILADVDGVTTLRGSVYQIDDTPVIVKKGIHLTKLQKFIKRGFDIVFAVIAAIVTAPIMLGCAVAVKLDSEGPVFYKQERYTIRKKVFNVYKFRTMVNDAEKNGAQLATENDPRITRVGRVLRALRLDELPQIYNILTGSMSVVGPRPERPVFADEFSKVIDSYDMRFCLKAGLTGYAQVYGKYNTRVSDKILMDIAYGTTYSFLLDIKLILLTIKIMFMKSATSGVDEERDTALSSSDREIKRRSHAVRFMDDTADEKQRNKANGVKGNEGIGNNSGIQL